MKDNQWVQHVSGQGEKWEVYQQDAHAWAVKDPHGSPLHWLPKSEYRLCSPPEVWVDVTGECYVQDGMIFHNGDRMRWLDGYRPQKITIYAGNADHHKAAFIVERKQS